MKAFYLTLIPRTYYSFTKHANFFQHSALISNHLQ